VPDGKREARDRHGGRRQRLRRAIAAQLRRDPTGECDRQPGGQHRQHPQPGQRVAEQFLGDPREQRGERRLVEVAQRQMPSGPR
jgi:hypothetical protein